MSQEDSLKATFKHFVESIDSRRGLTDKQEMDDFLTVAWTAFCRAAIILVSSDFFSHVVTIEAAKGFLPDEL